MVSGWVLAGFSDELPGEIVDMKLGRKPVLLVRDASGVVRAFDGICPHRGARLACGGRRQGDRMICPFHGHHIRLGATGGPDDELFVAEFPAIEVCELVFVHLGTERGAPGCGFPQAIVALKAEHAFVHGFSMPLPVPPTLVIENAFDVAHFGPVHGVPQATPLDVAAFDPAAGAPLTAQGEFCVAASSWDPEPNGKQITVAYAARAFSPSLIVSSLGGSRPYRFLVGATPDGQGGCTARVVLMLPRGVEYKLPPADGVEWLLAAMESQLAADREIWARLSADSPRRLQPGEDAIAAFWTFCKHFPDLQEERQR